MTNTIYTVHKGISRPIIFKGLKGQYILYAGGIIAGDLILFAILYAGINTYCSTLLCGALGIIGILFIYRCSNRYGEHGLAIKKAAQKVPRTLRYTSKHTFIQLKKQHGNYPPAIPSHP
jgi:hypothetical protein